MLAVLKGEEPDMVPVCVYDFMLRRSPWEMTQLPRDWYERLRERGLGLVPFGAFSTPSWPAGARHPGLSDVKWTRTEYVEKGLWKYRSTYETPVGSISSVMMADWKGNVNWGATPEEYLVKQPSDWRAVNHILKGIVDSLTPTYERFEMAKSNLGEDGLIAAAAAGTAWQNAWKTLAGPERAVIDFHEQPDELLEYIDLNRRWHIRLAELAAESPAEWIFIGDHISDMTSPRFYRKYCLPIYEIYSRQLAGTGKTLTVHMDGRLGSLRKEIAETPISVVESFSVPPTGDMTVAEARSIWPDKMLFVNTASHLAWAGPEEVRKHYQALAQEWGSKKGLLLELSEQLPPETVEAHMSAAMDAFGY